MCAYYTRSSVSSYNPATISGAWVATHQSNLYWKKTTSAQEILDGRAPDLLSEKLLSLKYHKSHDIRSRLPYQLPILRSNSMKRMLFYNAVKLWTNVSENALVRSFDVKKFNRNFFDSVQCKFTPVSFKIDRIY